MTVGLKEVFTKNIGWKIGGLVMALALWFHLATEKIYEKDFNVDIEIVGLPDDLRIERFVPPTAAITVTGSGKQLLKLSFSGRTKLRADLSSFKNPGSFVHKFRIDDLHPFNPSQFHRVYISGNGVFEIQIVKR